MLTILKDALNIEAISGTGLVVGTASQVTGHFARPRFVNDSRITIADSICHSIKLKKTTHKSVLFLEFSIFFSSFSHIPFRICLKIYNNLTELFFLLETARSILSPTQLSYKKRHWSHPKGGGHIAAVLFLDSTNLFLFLSIKQTKADFEFNGENNKKETTPPRVYAPPSV